MSPHEHAEDFVSHYLSIMHGDRDTSSLHKILEMKVTIATADHSPSLSRHHSRDCGGANRMLYWICLR